MPFQSLSLANVSGSIYNSRVHSHVSPCIILVIYLIGNPVLPFIVSECFFRNIFENRLKRHIF